MIKYLRYSGISVILSLNPLYWKVWPWFKNETNNEWGEAEKTYAFGFLFLTVRFWIDKGEW